MFFLYIYICKKNNNQCSNVTTTIFFEIYFVILADRWKTELDVGSKLAQSAILQTHQLHSSRYSRRL